MTGAAVLVRGLVVQLLPRVSNYPHGLNAGGNNPVAELQKEAASSDYIVLDRTTAPRAAVDCDFLRRNALAVEPSA